MRKKMVKGMVRRARSGKSTNKNPIGYIRSFGHNVVTSLETQTTTTLTVATAARTSDSEKFASVVAFMFYGTSGAISCTDSIGNTYEKVAEVIFNTNYQIDLFVSLGISTMAKNAVITVTHPASLRRIIMGDEFKHLSVDGVDVTAAAYNASPSTFATSGLTETTEQDKELLFGLIGVNGPSTDSFKRSSSSWSLLHDRGTNASDSHDIRLITQYRLVNKTDTYQASGTLGESRRWGAITQALKADGGNSDVTTD